MATKVKLRLVFSCLDTAADRVDMPISTSVVPCQHPADRGQSRSSKLPNSITALPRNRSSRKPTPRKNRAV